MKVKGVFLSISKTDIDTIIVKFKGGLGNQMSEYVFYAWLKHEYPQKRILADLSDFNTHRPHENSVIYEIFPEASLQEASWIDVFRQTGKIPKSYKGPLKSKVNSLIGHLNKLLREKKTVFRSDSDSVDQKEVKHAMESGFTYYDSFWQDSKYFKDIKDKVRKELQFEQNIENALEEDMKKSNSVSVHVRRGDYVGSIFEQEVNMDYYKKAISWVQAKVSNPVFYIFSDDKEYVKKAFDWLEDKIIVEGYDKEKSYLDMYLMSLFKTSIIANSTFSQWAAYLNVNEHPTIVYPDVEFMKHKVLDDWHGII